MKQEAEGPVKDPGSETSSASGSLTGMEGQEWIRGLWEPGSLWKGTIDKLVRYTSHFPPWDICQVLKIRSTGGGWKPKREAFEKQCGVSNNLGMLRKSRLKSRPCQRRGALVNTLGSAGVPIRLIYQKGNRAESLMGLQRPAPTSSATKERGPAWASSLFYT